MCEEKERVLYSLLRKKKSAFDLFFYTLEIAIMSLLRRKKKCLLSDLLCL
jgi:hypothetical protein